MSIEMQRLLALLASVTVAVVFGLELRRERREALLDWYIFQPPVTVTQMYHRWEGDSAWVTVLRLEFCPPKEARDMIKWDGRPEPIEVAVTFKWGVAQGKYFLSHDEAKRLAETVKNHGIGRRWDGPQWGSFCRTIESAVAADLLTHDQSMATLAHMVKA